MGLYEQKHCQFEPKWMEMEQKIKEGCRTFLDLTGYEDGATQL